ncbi:MAG TPA: hypothetical protein VEJ87_01470 [Acidimicrobiales bacterium]|nr:hypothetical protein [Acidimicrobiales bacterium]
MAVEIRRAVPDDAASIAAIHIQTWQVAYRGLMADELHRQWGDGSALARSNRNGTGRRSRAPGGSRSPSLRTCVSR